MKRNIAAAVMIASVLVTESFAVRSADACGIKLAVNGPALKKRVPRSSNPSDVLLVGDPPRRLERDLSAAGHRVEVAPNAEAAKRDSYAAVVSDPAQEQSARRKFGNDVVVVRSGDVGDDFKTVERQVARKPLRTEEPRPVVAAKPSRTPIAGGPEQPSPRTAVTAMQPKEEEAPPAPTPLTVVQPKSTPTPEPAQAEPRPAAESKPAAVASMADTEVFFGTGKAAAGMGQLAKVAKWLKKDSSVQVVIEGHADPTGNPDSNMDLSQKRAEWARGILVNAGVDEGRIEVSPFGDTRLKYGRSDGRNRRVVIIKK